MSCPHCGEKFESALELAHHVHKKHSKSEAPSGSEGDTRRKEQ